MPGKDTHSVLNYSNDNGVRLVISSDPKRPVPPMSAPEYVAVRVPMLDAREHLPPSGTLCTKGFELVKQKTALSHNDFWTNEKKIKEVYYPEIAALLCAATGATEVKPFHHNIRSSDRTKKRDGPAAAVHCDYQVKSSTDLYDGLHPKEMTRGRFAVINAWRNIRDDAVIQNDHLAMCDATSVASPDDFIATDLYEPDGSTVQMFNMDASHADRHRWYYYPDMKKDEVLLFMQYDSDYESRARYAFHSSAPVTEAPPGHVRESIEMRCIAFFPDHPVDSVPKLQGRDNQVKRVVLAVTNAINYLQDWDDGGKKWATQSVHLGESSDHRKFVEKLVELEAEKLRGGSEPFSEEQRKEATETLLSKGVVALAQSILPPPTGGKTEIAAKAIVDGLCHASYWDSDGRKWMKSCIARGDAGIREAATALVDRGVKGEDNIGIKGCTQQERKETIEACIRLGFKSEAAKYFNPL